MPKYSITQSADYKRALSELNHYFERGEITQSQASIDLKIGQPQISKILGGARKKPSKTFFELCQYAGIEFPGKITDPIADPRIQRAIKKVFDGTDESIELITRLIECAGVLHGVRSK